MLRWYAIFRLGATLIVMVIFVIVMGIMMSTYGGIFCFLIIVLIILVPTIIITYFGIILLRPTYNVRIYNNGFQACYRIESTKNKLPRSFYEARQYNWFRNHRYGPVFIPIEEVVEIWFIKRDNRMFRGSYMCVRVQDGTWYLLLIPIDDDAYEALLTLKAIFGNRWNSIYTGRY
jgi:hypothetical protein